MIKYNVKICVVLLLFFIAAILPAFSFETEGVWEMEHLYSQKISIGTVTDLYPTAPGWSAELVILGIQFLNHHMAVLYCETPSGSQSAEYKAFYKKQESRKKTQITFVLENEEEIELFLFASGETDIAFSYCDAGPQPGQKTGLYGSANKIVFRNHFGFLKSAFY